MAATWADGSCTSCGKVSYLTPLHGDKGGPLMCLTCKGAWHGEHGKKLKWRRVLTKTMSLYKKAGGNLHTDLDKIKRALVLGLAEPGFGADGMPNEMPDITTELLSDTLKLVHPDHQPPERREMAQRVTARLLELKPYVFPEPKPEPPVTHRPSDDTVVMDKPSTATLDELWAEMKSKAYPCELCEGQLTSHYCNDCKAKHEEKLEKDRALEEKRRLERNRRARERYQLRAQHKRLLQDETVCSNCASVFRAKRKDAKYCSASCRQKAYLKRDGKRSNDKPLSRDDVKRAVEGVFVADPDWAFTAAEMCQRALGIEKPERKHRVSVLAACKDLPSVVVWRSETRGQTRLLWNINSFMSYAVARERTSFMEHCLYEDRARIEASLTSERWGRDLLAEGGGWWRHYTMEVAEIRGKTDTPLYRKLRAEQDAVNASVFGTLETNSPDA